MLSRAQASVASVACASYTHEALCFAKTQCRKSKIGLAVGVQYRRAIRHPQPAEREYLAAQSTGTGVHVGKHVLGGWLVDAAMAESPAEEAGIVRGDCITEISRLCMSCLSKICFVPHCFWCPSTKLLGNFAFSESDVTCLLILLSHLLH